MRDGGQAYLLPHGPRLYVEVYPSERDGCFPESLGRGTCSDCCLCLFTKQRFQCSHGQWQCDLEECDQKNGLPSFYIDYILTQKLI